MLELMLLRFAAFVAVFILPSFITLSLSVISGRDWKRKKLNHKFSLGLTPSLTNDPSLQIKAPPKIKFDIKLAKWYDLSSIVSLRVKVFYPHLCGVEISNDSAKKKILEKMIERRREGSISLVAHESNGPFSFNLVGAVEMSSSDFKGTVLEKIRTDKKLYIADLCIRKDYRRMGIASSMLHAIELYALANQYEEIYLHVEVQNFVARSLYVEKGYIDIGHYSWATAFTESKLQKPANKYILLYKSVSNDSCIVNVKNS